MRTISADRLLVSNLWHNCQYDVVVVLQFVLCSLFSFSSQVVGKVLHGRLSKYFFEQLETVFPAGKVVTAKILRSLDVLVIYVIILYYYYVIIFCYVSCSYYKL